MFISTENGGRGGKNKYVVLKERVRSERTGKYVYRVLKRFGRRDAMTDEAFEALKAQYAQDREDKRRLTASQHIETMLKAVEKLRLSLMIRPTALNYGHYALKAIWNDALQLNTKFAYLQKQTRLQYDVNRAVSFLTFQKVLEPTSILGSCNRRDEYVGNPLGDVLLDNCYDAYDFLKENKERLLKFINKRMDAAYGKERATLVFYDVTNAYFEAPLTDAEMEYEQKDFFERFIEAAEALRDNGELSGEYWNADGELDAARLPLEALEKIDATKIQYLRMRGPSKEHRTNLPIVSIVMVIDKYGFPMDFEVFSGNTSEFKSMPTVIDTLKNRYKIKDAVIVADRGINSASNLDMLRKHNLGFLVAQKVTQFPDRIQKKLFEDEKYRPINSDRPDEGRFRVIRNWTKGKGDEAVNCTLVLTWNAKRAKRDNAILDSLVRLIHAKMARGDKVGKSRSAWAQLIRTESDIEQPILGVDEQELQKKRRLAGYAAMVYAEPGPEPQVADSDKRKAQNTKKTKATETDDDKMPYPLAATYKKLTEIEACFRIMKSHLGLRPMFVRNSNHIRGHITVCFLALLLIRIIQERLAKGGTALSIAEITRTLRTAQVVPIKQENGYYYLSLGNRRALRSEDPWASTADLIKKLQKGEVQGQDQLKLVMKACGLDVPPVLCSRVELGQALGTRFASDRDILSPLEWYLQNGEAPSPQDSPPPVAAG